MKKSLNVLHIKRLSVNSISLDYSFWVKIGQTFLTLFIGSNKMIVCSESSIVRSDVSFFVQDISILSSGPSMLCSSTRLLRSLLLNIGLLESTSYQQYVLQHRHNISVHLNSSLNRPRSLLSCCLCFTQHVLEKNLLQQQH